MPVTGPPALRERILTAARQRFIQQGYHGLSMRQIAEAVGASKPALYYYFRNKEELFLAVTDAYLDEMEALLDRIRDEGGPARWQIASLVRDILSQPAEKRAAIHMASREMSLLSEAARQAIRRSYRVKVLEKIQAILEQGIQKGELRRVDLDVAAWSLLGIMYPYFYQAYMQEARSPVDVAEQILSIYLDGLALPQE